MRWVGLILCAILGLVMLICGLLVPAHLRAVDVGVIESAGRKSRTLVEEGIALLNQQEIGAAEMVCQAARMSTVRGHEKLALGIRNFAGARPSVAFWGVANSSLENLFGSSQTSSTTNSPAIASFVIQEENREKILGMLASSQALAVRELMKCRTLTNTVLFPPSSSASGQAMDTAIAIGGLLLLEERLTPTLRGTVVSLSTAANKGGDSQQLEQVLLDLLSLGQRFNWGQLAVFIGQIEDTETLRFLANQAREADELLPVLFSAIRLSGKPAVVAKYLTAFGKAGLDDMVACMRYGAGGLNELLARNRRLCQPGWRQFVVGYDPFGSFYYFAVKYCLRMPFLALMIKWFFYLAGGFLFALAIHFGRFVPVLERPLQVRGFHLARESLFALGFLLVVLLLSEPFLAQESQKAEFPFRLRLPLLGNVAPAGTTANRSPLMNQLSLLTLLFFFVLQALIYTACLVRLAEIRRLNLAPRIKLKLLENEDHLFDAGLYLGFVGTIISLILVSLGVIKPSLMAAYSSTSFGIIFVSIFKIFHLRPLRRKLLLQAEGMPEYSDNKVSTNVARPS